MTPASRGLSLVELVIALALGATLLAAVAQLYRATGRGLARDNRIASTHDSLRFGMAQIAADIEMAGYLGPLSGPPSDIHVPAQTRAAYRDSGCRAEWAFDDLAPVDTVGNATAAAVRARFPCVAGVRAGSDVLAIKRVLGTCESRPAGNRFYLFTDGIRGTLATGGVGLPVYCDTATSATALAAYPFHPVIWYVGTDHGLPALCRERLSGAQMARDCVVPGIEDLQLEFGLDHGGPDGRADGVPDFFATFESPPDSAQRSRIVAVRVHLLARSAARWAEAGAARSFQLGDATHAPGADGHYRKALSVVVPVRNAARRLQPEPVG